MPSKKRRGNPNWGKNYPELPIGPTQFELLLKSLGIDDTDRPRLLRSMKVRMFVRKNYNTRYVPEWLIEAFGLHVDDSQTYMSRPTDNIRYIPVAEKVSRLIHV